MPSTPLPAILEFENQVDGNLSTAITSDPSSSALAAARGLECLSHDGGDAPAISEATPAGTRNITCVPSSAYGGLDTACLTRLAASPVSHISARRMRSRSFSTAARARRGMLQCGGPASLREVQLGL